MQSVFMVLFDAELDAGGFAIGDDAEEIFSGGELLFVHRLVEGALVGALQNDDRRLRGAVRRAVRLGLVCVDDDHFGLGADFDGCIRSDCVGDFGECLAFGVSRSFSAEAHGEWQRSFLRERARSGEAENGEECDEDLFHGVFDFAGGVCAIFAESEIRLSSGALTTRRL